MESIWINYENVETDQDPSWPRLVNALERLCLPSSLQSLTFQNRFNQSIEGVNLPDNLEHLSFGFRFNQSLEHVTLPAGLRSLTFGHNFNQDLLLGLGLNSRRQTLLNALNWLLIYFNHLSCVSIALSISYNMGWHQVYYPEVDFGVSNLTGTLPTCFTSCFGQSCRLRVQFPAALETLAFGNDFAQSLALSATNPNNMYAACIISLE